MSNQVAKVMIELFEEQSKMLKDHADRLRKALGEAGSSADAEETKKGKGSKKGDKPAVKRALSGFQVFMKEHLKSYRARHPEIAPKEVLTIISQRWKSLTEDKKAKYLQEAAKLNEETAKGGATATVAHADEAHEDHDEHEEELPTITASAKKRKASESETEATKESDDKKKKKHKKHKKHDEDSS